MLGKGTRNSGKRCRGTTSRDDFRISPGGRKPFFFSIQANFNTGSVQKVSISNARSNNGLKSLLKIVFSQNLVCRSISSIVSY